MKARELAKRERALEQAYKHLCIVGEEYRKAGCIQAAMEVESYSMEIGPKARQELKEIVDGERPDHVLP